MFTFARTIIGFSVLCYLTTVCWCNRNFQFYPNEPYYYSEFEPQRSPPREFFNYPSNSFPEAYPYFEPQRPRHRGFFNYPNSFPGAYPSYPAYPNFNFRPGGSGRPSFNNNNLFPTTTAQTPLYQSCLSNCPTTGQYDPACGSDGLSYHNRAALNCARSCGLNVGFVRLGLCVPRPGTTGV